MKRILLLMLVLWIGRDLVQAQTLERRYLEHDGLNRTFLLYVPSTYDHESGEVVPIIFAFHGINATDENLVGVGLNGFAERENFLVVYPQAAPAELGFFAWNCGTLLATNNDDSGYWLAMLTTLSEEFHIDDRRVYTCGFSMGGMMSNQLACEFSDRIAAHASVSGPLTVGTYAECNPERKVPVMHIHGIADETVPYSGNNVLGLKGAMATMYWWAQRNGCSDDYVEEAVPDTADEYYHVDRLVFPDCDAGAEVIHYRIDHWPHSWPGPSRNIYGTAEIVNFFMRHELNEEVVLAEQTLPLPQWIRVGPNPFSGSLRLDVNGRALDRWTIYGINGQVVLKGRSSGLLPTEELESGMYFFVAESDGNRYATRLVRQ